MAKPFWDEPGGGTTPSPLPTAPPKPPPWAQFQTRLNEINPLFFDIGQGLIDQGQGTAVDPLLQAQRERGMSSLNAGLARTGATGSVAMNERRRADLGFDLQGRNRRDQQLQSGLQLQQTGLQNELAIPGLEIAQQNAQNAGKGGGKK